MCCKKRKETIKKPRVRFLESLDIFGVEINIKFNQQNKHRTRFGGFVTLIIVGVLFILFSSSIKEMVYKANPSVVYEDKLVSNPSRYNLTKENFSFTITLLDSQFQPIMDESIFRIEGNFLYKQTIVNEDGTKQKGEFKNRAIKMSKCEQSSFIVPNTEEYFLSLPYQNMYCIDKFEDLYLEGQFEKDDFSVLEIRIIPCDKEDKNNRVECIDKELRDSILAKSLLQVYYSNQVVQVYDYQVPFQSVGQSYFWESNIDYQQNINLLFKNTFVEDNVGLFSDHIKTSKSLTFSSERTMLSSKEDLSFYKVSIFLEKNKEQYYRRRYLNIPEALSKVGGIYNFLFVVGCIIAQPYSQMQLHRKLFNQTFQVAKNSQNKKSTPSSANEVGNTSLDKQCKPKVTESVTDPKSDKKIIKFSLSPRHKKLQLQRENTNDLQRRISLFNVTQSASVADKTQRVHLQQLALSIKGQFQNLKVKTTEYLSYYFNCFKIFKSDIQEMVSFGTEKIYDYTDICFIVNKLLEIEKLKHLILNDQQIKLFEFIPKPKIDLQIIGKYKQIEQKPQKSANLNEDEEKGCQSMPQSGGEINGEDHNNISSRKQINILSIQNRNLQEKASQAQLAFNLIYKNQIRKSKVDLKLIQMLDENLIQMFNNNTFEESSVNSVSLGQNTNDFDTLTFSKGISQHRIKLEKSQFRRQTEQESDSLDPDDEMIEMPSRTSSKEIQGITLYENKKKNFIAHTEEKNTNFKDELKEEALSYYENQNIILSPHRIFSETSKFAQYDSSPTKSEGNNLETNDL